ncbi:MAG: hypothetical protein D6722_23165 [Bacteroidetes bacterium]|nr:MAG: hypothetical protein D6722_23165 [Bacteroidota bacterium]
MRKSELSQTQLRDLNVFNLLLEYNGWVDERDTEKRMDAGESMNPEGMRAFYGPRQYLQMRFHAPINMMSLFLEDQQQDETIQVHFLFDSQPERILEWMIQVANDFSLDTYPDLLREADGRCEMILLEVSETEIYEVKPSTKA